MGRVTDEERRDVARRLRELAGGYVTTGELESALGICLSSPEVDLERDERDLHRLADLIEPESERTCRVEASHEEEGGGCYSYFEHELSCEHEIAWGDQLPPSYCPNCGAEVD